MLEMYADKVEGSSEEAVVPNDFLHLPSGDYHPLTDKLNVAESEGAVHRGSMEEQWGYFNKSLGWMLCTILF